MKQGDLVICKTSDSEIFAGILSVIGDNSIILSKAVDLTSTNLNVYALAVSFEFVPLIKSCPSIPELIICQPKQIALMRKDIVNAFLEQMQEYSETLNPSET